MDPKSIPGGGPAFPTENGRQVGNNAYLYEGMTLRDYFAAQALPVVWSGIPDDVNRDVALASLGSLAYEMADAMLAARPSP